MALVGNEVLYVQGVTPGGSLSPVTQQTTTGAIAGLASEGTSAGIINTSITTAGNGTLTAAGLVGGLIVRSGPSAAFSDATDTAAHILAALPEVVVGATFLVRIKNATAYPETITAGANVTLSSTNLVPPFSIGNYYATVTSATAVSLTHLNTTAIGSATSVVNPLASALNTVGAGTVLAAAIVGGVVQRGGSQSNTAVADTTDTAANIIAGSVGMLGRIGESFLFLYQNNTNANVTLGGGMGVTVSGVTVVPANGAALYVVTYTAAATITMVGVLQSNPSTANGTFVANGSTAVVVADTRITANSVVSFGLNTVGGTPAGAPFMSAVTAGTGFSVKAVAGDSSTYNYRIVG